MQQSFWRRTKRQLRRAHVRALRVVGTEGRDEAIIHSGDKNVCTDLHVLGCKFLHTQENITPDFELFDLTRTTAPTDSNNLHTDHVGGPIAPQAVGMSGRIKHFMRTRTWLASWTRKIEP